jgi:inhibitor of KinA sporulation pathway (predicted exonuclease)
MTREEWEPIVQKYLPKQKAAGGAVTMAAGGAVDYESKFNQMLQDHVADMAEGGAVDYESRFNDMLQKHVQGMAEGGEVNEYNSDPDMADGGRFIQAPAFANGGAVKSIWTVN